MMTVVYGDFYPRTHIGRCIAVLSAFWGIFWVSMVVVALTNSSIFDKREEKAYFILMKLNSRKELEKRAYKLI